MNEVYDKYYLKFYHWALNKTHNKDDALDLTNDIFVAIFTYFKKDIKIEKVENLLWKIASNIWNKKAEKYIQEHNNTSINDFEIPSFDKSLDKIIYKEIINNLNNIGLTKNEQIAFNLYYLKDMTINEISKKINKSEANIKYYLYCARKKVKENYD